MSIRCILSILFAVARFCLYLYFMIVSCITFCLSKVTLALFNLINPLPLVLVDSLWAFLRQRRRNVTTTEATKSTRKANPPMIIPPIRCDFPLEFVPA